MGVVTSEELKPSQPSKQLGGQILQEERDTLKEEQKMKDMERIKPFIEKHKKLLLKLAK